MNPYKSCDISKKLKIGIEFFVPIYRDNLYKLKLFRKEFNIKIKTEFRDYIVSTQLIDFYDYNLINNILKFYNNLGLVGYYNKPVHIHFLYINDKMKYNATHVSMNGYYIINYLTIVQELINNDLFGRNFDDSCMKFKKLQDRLPLRLTSYSGKHWVNFTETTLEFRLPLFIDCNQMMNVVNKCSKIYDSLVNLLSKDYNT